jgi:hypothetical protein
MNSDLDRLLLMLLTLCLHRAHRLATPAEPPDEAWERETDEYCYRFARTNEAEEPSPEVACAMIPRLRLARVCAPLVESQFPVPAGAEAEVKATREILELLLVTLWQESLKARWLAGEFEN